MIKWKCVNTNILMQDNSWINTILADPRNVWTEQYPYTYILKSGVTQKRLATIKVIEYEYKIQFLKILIPYFKKSQKQIYVNFDKKIGEIISFRNTGILSYNFDILPNETYLDCLKRMQQTVKFE